MPNSTHRISRPRSTGIRGYRGYLSVGRQSFCAFSMQIVHRPLLDKMLPDLRPSTLPKDLRSARDCRRGIADPLQGEVGGPQFHLSSLAHQRENGTMAGISGATPSSIFSGGRILAGEARAIAQVEDDLLKSEPCSDSPPRSEASMVELPPLWPLLPPWRHVGRAAGDGYAGGLRGLGAGVRWEWKARGEVRGEQEGEGEGVEGGVGVVGLFFVCNNSNT